MEVVNAPEAVERLQGALVAAAERRGYPKASLFAIRLALHEAMSNAFQHGHASLPPDTPITVEYSVTDNDVTITVEDLGPGFDPSGVPDPTLQENIERGSGRGLLLIRAYMAVAEYNHTGNRLRMVYKRPARS